MIGTIIHPVRGQVVALPRRLLATSRVVLSFSRFRGRHVALLVVVSLIAACASHSITTEDIEQIDGPEAEVIARDAALIYPGDSIGAWYVNATEVSQTTAMTIPSSAILSVSMQRSTPTSPSAIIFTVRQPNDLAPPTANLAAGASTRTSRNPLCLVDGVQVTDAQGKAALERNDIQSIELIKAATAVTTLTDPNAVNGVIKITTSHKAQ